MADLSVKEPESPEAFPPVALPAAHGKAGRRRRSEGMLAVLFLLPSALILGSFGFFPLLYAFYVSLHKWTLVKGSFIGFGNYLQALREPDFWQALQVTVYYVIGTVPLTMILGFGIAALLNRRLAGLTVYRVLSFTPYIVSPVAAAAVWRWIYHPQYGLANTALDALHRPPHNWLKEPHGIVSLIGGGLGIDVPSWAAGPSVALMAIMLVSIWHALGFAVVVLLAGLAAIPTEVTEAARLDGASGWSLARWVTLPLLSPTLFFLLIVFTIRAFQTFNQIYVLTPDGGPLHTTRNITMYIFTSFYQNTSRLGYGYGAAVAFLLFGFILMLTVLQFKLLGERVHYR
jgi:multiple sugar transport system permease protein